MFLNVLAFLKSSSEKTQPKNEKKVEISRALTPSERIVEAFAQYLDTKIKFLVIKLSGIASKKFANFTFERFSRCFARFCEEILKLWDLKIF